MARHPTPASKLYVDPVVTGSHLEVCPQAVLMVEDVVSRLNQNSQGCV